MKFLMFGLAVMALLMTSCEKDGLEGPIGPQGLQGEQGPAGSNGIQGEPGPAGTDGTNGTDGSAGPGSDGSQGETGATGPAGNDGVDGTNGQDGEAGPAGSQGPKGNNGSDGEDGNANVMASDWIFTNFINTGSQPSKFLLVEDSNLTAAMVNGSVILAYGKQNDIGDEDFIYALPTTLFNSYFGYGMAENPDGTYDIRFSAQSISGSSRVFSEMMEIKYFIIPANATTGKNAGVEFAKMSYRQLTEYFDISE